MNPLDELDQYCQQNGLWLSYCSYKGQFKCYVNPGTTMTGAPWYKSRDEAVTACWAAMGIAPATVIANAIVKYTGAQILDDNVLSDPPDMEEIIHPKRRGRPKGSKNKPKEVASENK